MQQNMVNLKKVKSKLFNVAENEWRADMKSKLKLRNYESIIFKVLCLNLQILNHSLHNLGLCIVFAYRNQPLPLNQGYRK